MRERGVAESVGTGNCAASGRLRAALTLPATAYIKPPVIPSCAKTSLLSLLLILAGAHCACALPMAAQEAAAADAGSHRHAAHGAGHLREAPQANCPHDLHGGCDGACGIAAAVPGRDAAPATASEHADPEESDAVARSAKAVPWRRQRAPPREAPPVAPRGAATPVSRCDVLLD